MGVDPSVPSTINAFPPGYIDKPNEVVVGLQTDEPLKRSIKPCGGVNVVKAALQVGAAQQRCDKQQVHA
jgi:formate C-acetyltransferase